MISCTVGDYLGIFSIDPWTIVVSACNLLIIYLILRKFFYNPVMKIMKEREEQITDQYKAADEAKKEAESSKAIYSERMRHAEEEAGEIIKNAHTEAEKISSEMVNEASMKADAIREKAALDIEREKEKAQKELKKEIAEISVDIASKVVGREVKKEDHARYISDFVNNAQANGEGDE